jgi:hypothetical protein
MTAALLELLPAVLELLAYAAVSVGLSLVGLYVEAFALATLQGGRPGLGAWAAVMGAVALLFAYRLATDEFRTKLTEIRRGANDP